MHVCIPKLRMRLSPENSVVLFFFFFLIPRRAMGTLPVLFNETQGRGRVASNLDPYERAYSALPIVQPGSGAVFFFFVFGTGTY